MTLLHSQPLPSGYCFLRVSVRKPDGSVQDYVVDGDVTVKDFAREVLGVEVSSPDATPQPFLGSIQILEVVTIPGGVTPIPFNAPIIRSSNSEET